MQIMLSCIQVSTSRPLFEGVWYYNTWDSWLLNLICAIILSYTYSDKYIIVIA